MARLRSRCGITLVELLVVIAIIGVLIALLLPAIQQVRAAAHRTGCANNLKQLGLALHQYHDSNNTLPPGAIPGTNIEEYPYVSWLTRLLPYVEQASLWRVTESAYRQDRSPFHNPPHVGLDTVVALFICPAEGRAFSAQTSYGYQVAFTCYLGNEGTDQTSGDGVLYSKSRVRLTDIRDGTSQTLLVGERPPSTDFFYGWWYAGYGQDGTGSCDMVLGARERNTSPKLTGSCPPGPYSYQSGRLDNQCDQFHFWSLHSGGAHFLFADGSVHFLSYSAAPLLPALATRSGGEAVTMPE